MARHGRTGRLPSRPARTNNFQQVPSLTAVPVAEGSDSPGDELAVRRARRQAAGDLLALNEALDHLDGRGLCACWLVPGRRHRAASWSSLAPTGTA
jgi:hypothetical protein